MRVPVLHMHTTGGGPYHDWSGGMVLSLPVVHPEVLSHYAVMLEAFACRDLGVAEDKLPTNLTTHWHCFDVEYADEERNDA